MNFPCPLPGRHRKGCYQGEGKGGSFQTISAGGRDAHVPTEGGKRVQFRGAEEMPKNGDIPKRNAGDGPRPGNGRRKLKGSAILSRRRILRSLNRAAAAGRPMLWRGTVSSLFYYSNFRLNKNEVQYIQAEI
jgi:hypothetical protein